MSRRAASGRGDLRQGIGEHAHLETQAGEDLGQGVVQLVGQGVAFVQDRQAPGVLVGPVLGDRNPEVMADGGQQFHDVLAPL